MRSICFTLGAVLGLLTLPSVHARQIIYTTGGTALSSAESSGKVEYFCAEAPELSPAGGEYILSLDRMRLRSNGRNIPLDAKLFEYLKVEPNESGFAVLRIDDEGAFRKKYALNQGEFTLEIGPAVGISKPESQLPNRLQTYERIRDQLNRIAPRINSAWDRHARIVKLTATLDADSLPEIGALVRDAFQLHLWASLPTPQVNADYQLVNWHLHADHELQRYNSMPRILDSIADRYAADSAQLTSEIRGFASLLKQRNWTNSIEISKKVSTLQGSLPVASTFGSLFSFDQTRRAGFNSSEEFFTALKEQARKRIPMNSEVSGENGRISLRAESKLGPIYLKTKASSKSLSLLALAVFKDSDSSMARKLFADAEIARQEYHTLATEKLKDHLRQRRFDQLRVLMDLPVSGDRSTSFSESVKESNQREVKRLHEKFTTAKIQFEHLRGKASMAIAAKVIKQIMDHRDVRGREFLVVVAHNEPSPDGGRELVFADNSRISEQELIAIAHLSKFDGAFFVLTCPKGIPLTVKHAEALVADLGSATEDYFTLEQPVGFIREKAGQLATNIVRSVGRASGGAPPGDESNGESGGGGPEPFGSLNVFEAKTGDVYSIYLFALPDQDDDDEDEKATNK